MNIESLATPAATFAATILTVIATIWGVRARARVDIGASLTTGFASLTDQLQQEREELMAISAAQKKDIRDLETVIRALEASDRRLRRHIEDIEARLVAAGMTPPPHVGWE